MWPEAVRIDFGAAGNATAVQIAGWSHPEDGFTWSIGGGSLCHVPYPPGDGVLTLELCLAPMRAPPRVPSQRLKVMVNDDVCGVEDVFIDSVMSWPLPRVPEAAGGTIRLALVHPRAISPSEFGVGDDQRHLGVAVRYVRLRWLPKPKRSDDRGRRSLPALAQRHLPDAVRSPTVQTPADLMGQFESIGHNCEFGLVQRAFGADPKTLLRFGGIRPFDLLRGLETCFAGIDDPAQITLSTEINGSREEYAVRCEAYGMVFHSFQATSEVGPDRMRRRMSAYLNGLRRGFQQALLNADRLLVFQYGLYLTPAFIRPLRDAVRYYGDNAILFVTADQRQPGSVDQVDEDIFHGHIDHLMPQDHPDRINTAAWLSMCANAYWLWRNPETGPSLC